MRGPLRALLCASLTISLAACAVPAATAPAGPDEAVRRSPVTTGTVPVVEAPATSTVASEDTTTTTAAPADPTASGLEAIWAAGPQSACLAVSDGDRVLFERNPDAPLVPASTMKLLTGLAVLEAFRPDERLRTPVLSLAPPVEGVVEGDLYLVGGGDPTLGTLPWGASFRRQPQLVTAIEVLANRLVEAGVREVRGRVVGDDGRHERVRYLPTWPSRYVLQTGPLSALTVNDAIDGYGPGAKPFTDPAAGAAGVLAGLLRERGVTVHGGAASGHLVPGSVELAAVESPTMAELVGQMLRESDNQTAELLVRELGLRVHGRGTSAAGTAALHETLRDLGLPMAGVNVLDGSGLDPQNRVTCRLLSAILLRGHPDVDRGLAVAAQTGTLYKRFLATPVAGHLRAKTGTIRAVSSLAGHVDTASGRRLTFAYVLNGTSGEGYALQDLLGHHLFGS
jgi:serine-type D-Ala-D-Ala carboxypeptidase/endopeptidase (penicillin-binding protein 4)